MEKLNDDIHRCEGCEHFPCSSQEEVSRVDICKECISHCCRAVLVALVPCEEHKFERGDIGSLKMGDDGWCYYYRTGIGCSIYDIRPITCRIASCRFIREGKYPVELKELKEKMRK